MNETTTTITKDSSSVTLINVFTVQAGDQDRLIEMLIEATAATMRNIPGFISANIHKSLDGLRVTNYAQWRSREDFEAMLQRPEAREHMAPIAKIATFDWHLYQVVDVVHA